MHLAIRLLKKIPKGRVATYKELARVCKTSPRAIGRIMAHNADPEHFPCYKVVASSGLLIGYSAPGGIKKKRKLLQEEGIGFSGKRARKEYFYTFGKPR
ncbi:MAG: MGMT family protein [Candidatus Sungbacteria bacterium]|nr:MGMT family protein [Candidatus Sungbacteria bacterium]